MGAARRHLLAAAVLLPAEPALSPFPAWLAHSEMPGTPAGVGELLVIGATTSRTLLRQAKP